MSRGTFAILVVATLCGIITAADGQEREQASHLPISKQIIDTHIHLYDTTRPAGVPWPPADDTVLYKPHLPAEFKRVAQPAGVTGVIIVEASDRLEDNRWVLDLVNGDNFFVGLVGNIDPYRDDFGQQLAKLRRDRRLVGVRVHLMGKGPGVSDDPRLLNSLRQLDKAELSVDILMNGEGVETIRAVDHIARQIPTLHIIVNHVLGYDIDGKPPGREWTVAVKSLAANPNVYAKVSGLYQRCTIQPATKDIEYYGTLLDILWEQFGSERLIYGSNWPCTKKSGDYASFVQLVGEYFNDKGEDAADRYFWQNAVRAYRLNQN